MAAGRDGLQNRKTSLRLFFISVKRSKYFRRCSVWKQYRMVPASLLRSRNSPPGLSPLWRGLLAKRQILQLHEQSGPNTVI